MLLLKHFTPQYAELTILLRWDPTEGQVNDYQAFFHFTV